MLIGFIDALSLSAQKTLSGPSFALWGVDCLLVTSCSGAAKSAGYAAGLGEERDIQHARWYLSKHCSAERRGF